MMAARSDFCLLTLNFFLPDGPIAQRLEPPAHNRPVPGSNPGGPTTLRSHFTRRVAAMGGPQFSGEHSAAKMSTILMFNLPPSRAGGQQPPAAKRRRRASERNELRLASFSPLRSCVSCGAPSRSKAQHLTRGWKT